MTSRLTLALVVASSACAIPELPARSGASLEVHALRDVEQGMSERFHELRELEGEGDIDASEWVEGELQEREGRTEVFRLDSNRCAVVFAIGTLSLTDIDIRAFDSMGRSLGGDRRSEPSQYAAYAICAGPLSRRIAFRIEAAEGEGEFRAGRVLFTAPDVASVVDVLDAVMGPPQRARSERAHRWADRLRDRGYEPRSGARMSALEMQPHRVPVRVDGPGCHSFGLFVDGEWSRSGVLLEDEWGRLLVSADYEGDDAFLQVCSRRAAQWTLQLPEELAPDSTELWRLHANPMRSAGQRGLWWGVRASDRSATSLDAERGRWRTSLARNGVGSAIAVWRVASEPHEIGLHHLVEVDEECVAVVGIGDERGRGLTLTILPNGRATDQQRVVSETSRIVGIHCSQRPIGSLELQVSARGPSMSYSFSVHRVDSQLRERLLQLRRPGSLRLVAEALAEGWVLAEVLERDDRQSGDSDAQERSSLEQCERWMWLPEGSRDTATQSRTQSEVREWVSCAPLPVLRTNFGDDTRPPAGQWLRFVVLREPGAV